MGHAYLVFFIDKKGGTLGIFFCVFMFVESRLYKILLFFLVWGGEGMRSMMPREVYDNGAAESL